MKILIVWETTEYTNIYSIEEDNSEKIKKMKKASGQIVNSTDEDEFALWLDSYLSDDSRCELIPPEEAPLIDLTEYKLLIQSGFAF